MLKLLISPILPCRNCSPQFILWSLCFIFISNLFIHTLVQAKETISASKSSTVKKISPEEAFSEGQKYLDQTNLPLAELTLTSIPSNSPYAKLLAGNIAVMKADYNRAFLLLLPLQSNQSLTKIATSSLHASLSSLYEKQGDIANALDQMIAQEPYLDNSELVNSNHNRIWHLLSALDLQDLISVRGESSNTIIQGWIDLSLASKNPDITNGLTNWTNSYPDHVAIDFAKKLLTQKLADNNPTSKNVMNSLTSNGKIALILPVGVKELSEKALAFELGFQAALENYNLLNEVKVYPSLDNQESISEQYNTAKSEDYMYFIAPTFSTWIENSSMSLPNIFWRNENNEINGRLFSTSSLLQDEATTINTFAVNNAIQRITIINTNDEADFQLTKIFKDTWANFQGTEIRVITLNQNLHGDSTELLDLKTKIAEQPHDTLLLATSSKNAYMIKPYLNISTPVLAFSNVNEIANTETPNSSLNSIRFPEIPFLIEMDQVKFTDLRNKTANIQSYELIRWFALGADYLQLLINSSQNISKEALINGLTGKLTIDKNGSIKRQLSMARFTYDGIILDQ